MRIDSWKKFNVTRHLTMASHFHIKIIVLLTVHPMQGSSIFGRKWLKPLSKRPMSWFL